MENSNKYTLTTDQIEKLGNTAIFFADRVYELNKTKLLKLVYLTEKLYIKKHAMPFLGLSFHAWKFGPVQIELYANLDPTSLGINTDNNPSILSKFITLKEEGNNFLIQSLRSFDDSNFSDDEIDTMENIAKTYQYHDAKQLVFITHKGSSLWYKTVLKENGLIDKFEKGLQSNSDLILDFSDQMQDENVKNFYYTQLELLEFSHSLKQY